MADVPPDRPVPIPVSSFDKIRMSGKAEGLDFIILTGLSGAGKSTALRSFEDVGFYCMDNLPPQLLPKLAEILKGSGQRRRVAAVCDVRSQNISDELLLAAAAMSEMHAVQPLVIFLDASTEILLRRFSETRRKHPLGAVEGLEQSIEREREMLGPLRDHADILIDTSRLSLREFQEKLIGFFATDAKPRLMVFITSFGYKYGLPAAADIVFDVRFLPNPFYDPVMGARTGLDADVRRFVESSDDARIFLEKTEDWLAFLIPKFVAEGKSHLGISIGCTGGRHRSVVIAERLKKFLDDRFGVSGSIAASILHRDIGK